jgi:mannosyl-oligosaccharide alpha-1,2-mannosidase
MQSEPNTKPFDAEPVPIDYNFSAFEPLGGGRFTEYKDGDSPFAISHAMKTKSNSVAVSRRFHVVNAMKHVWNNYKEHAFGKDELLPVSGKGSDNWGGMGVT